MVTFCWSHGLVVHVQFWSSPDPLGPHRGTLSKRNLSIFCHTCSLCRVELVVQFPARGSTRVLLCLFPGVLWLWHFLYSVGPHPVSSLHIYTFVVSWVFMAGAASQAGDADSSRAPGLTSGMSTVVLYCWCHSDSASVLLYFTLVCVSEALL